jgi:hypothetical protein
MSCCDVASLQQRGPTSTKLVERESGIVQTHADHWFGAHRAMSVDSAQRVAKADAATCADSNDGGAGQHGASADSRGDLERRLPPCASRCRAYCRPPPHRRRRSDRAPPPARCRVPPTLAARRPQSSDLLPARAPARQYHWLRVTIDTYQHKILPPSNDTPPLRAELVSALCAANSCCVCWRACCADSSNN